MKITNAAHVQITSKGYTGIEVKVVQGGCAGLQYIFELHDHVPKNFNYIIDNNIYIFISKEDLDIIGDAYIDYKKEFMREYFYLEVIQSTCRCGKSFNG